jgi:hypothetical protein
MRVHGRWFARRASAGGLGRRILVGLTSPVTPRRYNPSVADKDWMRSDFKPSPSSPPTREEEFVFAMTKDVRVMTGALRQVDDERWEVIYRADASLYLAQTLASRALAEQHLALHKELLEGVGWRETTRA